MKKQYLFCFVFTIFYQPLLATKKINERIVAGSMFAVKGYFLLLFAFLLAYEGVGQTEKQFTPPSPQSLEFIKYGDYPVSYFSGVPDISIPIHQVDYYGYQLPLTLKYHASGIRAGSHVDQTGIGWTLFGGGEISRTVKSVPDESNDFKKGIFITPATSFYYKRLKELSEGYPTGSPIGDLAYDEFNVTLPDGNFFKFYITNYNGTYQVHTNPAPSGMKVSFVYPLPHNVGSAITSFTVIDERGIKYDFTDAEYSEGMYGYRFKTTWKLTKITLPQSGKTIRFTYRSTNDVIVPKKNYSRVIRDTVGHISCGYCPGMPDNKCIAQLPVGDKTSWVVNDYIQDNNNFILGGLVPDSIIFGDQNIKFNYDVLRWSGYYSSKLNNILLNDVNKKVSFYQTGIDGIGIINALDSIVIRSTPSIPALTYKFGYTTRSIAAGPAPAIDHWGYILSGIIDINSRNEVYDCGGLGAFATFNLPNFETMVAGPVNPTDECLFESWTGPNGQPRYKTKLGNGNRTPEGYPQLMLNRIDYPTGGYTLFDYESNQYLVTEENTTDPVMRAGGYRIKTISSYTNGVLSGRKSYKYGVGESGYGYAPVEPSAKSYQKTYIDFPLDLARAISPYLPSDVRYRERNFSSDNFTALLGSLPPVMYEEVTEYNGTTDANTGKTIYKFNIMKRLPPETAGYGGDHLQTNPVTGDYYVLNDEQWKYGQLTDKEVYKRESSGYKLIQRQKQTWQYEQVSNLDDRSGFYMYDRAIYTPDGNDPYDGGQFAPCYQPNVFQSNPHYIRTGKAFLQSSIITDYTDVSDSMTTRELYAYDAYGHLSDKLSWNSDGYTHKIIYKYPYDRSGTGLLSEALTASNIVALDSLVAKNIVSPTIQESHLYGSNASVIKRTDYLLFNNNPLPAAIRSKINGSAIQEDAVYSQYDAIGNPLQFTGRNGVVTGLLWGYNGRYLVARVSGADYATVSGKVAQNLLDNPASDQALRTELNKLRTIPNSLVATYTYKVPVGMTSETGPDNRTLYYEYDDFNRLQRVRDQDNYILKQYDYRYQAVAHNNPIWQVTGNLRCKPCPANASYTSNVQQQEEKDTNPNSATYDQTRWTDNGVSSSCVVTADWQNTTTAIRCKLSAGANTGEQEREQEDKNPCSNTYGQKRWMVTSTNTTACPLPVYAKLTYENYNYSYTDAVRADVVVRFYSNAACTIPATVSNLVLNYSIEGFNGSTSFSNDYSMTVSGSSVTLAANAELSYESGSTFRFKDYYIIDGAYIVVFD